MSNEASSQVALSAVNPEHIELLSATLRAPSAHNTQAWRIKPLRDGRGYDLHYDQHERLPEDPNDKDAYLTMGAFVETMVLQAPNFGLSVSVTPKLTRTGQDFFVATVTIDASKGSGQNDPLSKWVGKRATNRNRYGKDVLPASLEQKLQDLGNKLVEPGRLKNVVMEASMKSWANPRYVNDLKLWIRKDDASLDGLTATLMNLTKVDLLGLELAYWRGSFKSKIMERIFSDTEVSMFATAPRAGVLSAKDMSPSSLFDAGRRLLRSWVEIVAAGYSYQPYSVGVDDEAAAQQVAKIAGVEVPVALYRIGKAAKIPETLSNRRPLADVLI